MNLLLWRHADAEDGSPDLARPLSAKGRAQASLAARWITRHAPAHLRILVSPALRCRQTADALGQEYSVLSELAPGATPGQILEALGLPGAAVLHETLLVVGHQPWIGETAAFLVTGEASAWSVRKSSVWWLGHRERAGEQKWSVKTVIDADLL